MMRFPRIGLLAAVAMSAAASAAITTAVAADPPAEPAAPPLEPGPIAPIHYPTHESVGDRMIGLANMAKGRASIVRVATSREGRTVQALVLGEQDMTKRRPAMLVVAGMDGVNLGSTEQCLAALEVVLREHAALLDTMRLYVIAEANPDARNFAITRKHPRATNARVVDDDRDGKFDEDAPGDYNGDGFVNTLRRVAPPGEKATHVVDAADPRIVRPANRDKGEVATHQIFVEGVDNDLDGRSAEDGEGGVDLDRNFPHRWPEFAPDAGPYQLSEPESLGIAEFVRARPDIVWAVVFGRHDTLASFPDTKDKDFTGRTPMVYLAEDHDLYRDAAKLWKEKSGLEKSQNADLAGSLVLWLANHRGIAAVAANGWTRPEVPKKTESTETEPTKAESDAGAGAPDAAKPAAPDAPPAKESGDPEQSAWLTLAEDVYRMGFQEWTPWKHPIHGACEIGGFTPFFRESPTIVQARDLGRRSAPFLAALADKRPRVEVSEARLTRLADGLARIDFRVTNAGTIATTTEMGRITDAVPPVVVRLLADGKPLAPEAVLAGRPVEKLPRIEASASREFSWIVRLPASGAVDVSVAGPFFDEIRMRANGGAK